MGAQAWRAGLRRRSGAGFCAICLSVDAGRRGRRARAPLRPPPRGPLTSRAWASLSFKAAHGPRRAGVGLHPGPIALPAGRRPRRVEAWSSGRRCSDRIIFAWGPGAAVLAAGLHDHAGLAYAHLQRPATPRSPPPCRSRREAGRIGGPVTWGHRRHARKGLPFLQQEPLGEETRWRSLMAW